MKKHIFLVVVGLMMAATAWSASPINYNGTNLTYNDEFTRSQCGTAYKNDMTEVSGLACSRVTPGYLWAHGDENTGNNKKIVAISPSGTLAMTEGQGRRVPSVPTAVQHKLRHEPATADRSVRAG